jgi:putative N6-adenine-specific DNA methylase
MEFLAITAPGVEGVLAKELASLDIRARQILNGGVEFRGNAEQLMRANLYSRIANRIIVRMAAFHASSFHELERRAKKIEWERFLSKDSLFRFRVTSRKSKLYHSDAIAERLGLAASGATGAKVMVSADDDDEAENAQLFIVRVANDEVTISADSSGDLLHRRGYRQAVAKAPLRETLAAAMLAGSGWDVSSPLVDPMCGSGTIAIEAALMARGAAPGIGRTFAFERWREHDAPAWKKMKADAAASAKQKAGVRIIASDRDEGAIAATLSNAERAGVAGDIEASVRAISDVEFPAERGWVVSNPPYGQRVGESDRLMNLYSQIGRILRGPASGYVLALLSADRRLEGQIGLELREVFRTTNGGIPVRLVVGQDT